MNIEKFAEMLTQMGVTDREDRGRCGAIFDNAGENDALDYAKQIVHRRSQLKSGIEWISADFEALKKVTK